MAWSPLGNCTVYCTFSSNGAANSSSVTSSSPVSKPCFLACALRRASVDSLVLPLAETKVTKLADVDETGTENSSLIVCTGTHGLSDFSRSHEIDARSAGSVLNAISCLVARLPRIKRTFAPSPKGLAQRPIIKASRTALSLGSSSFSAVIMALRSAAGNKLKSICSPTLSVTQTGLSCAIVCAGLVPAATLLAITKTCVSVISVPL